ncbi:MAG: ABC transporter ATP-binding protein [Rhodocyclaceae bacterium]|jgi:ABC-type multidrug transport system fused ATPase/permease subunit|nr:ABC transporter ATP-binding protein [Rhodocyclaceae bacterium]
MAGLLRELAGILTSKERWKAVFIGTLALAGALAETVGVGAVFPLMALLMDASLANSDARLAMLFRLSGADSVERFVLFGAIGLLAFYAAKNLLLAWLYRLQTRFSAGAEARIGADLLASFLALPFSERLAENSAERLRIITVETGRATAGFLASLMQLVTEGCVIFCLVLLLFVVNPLATGIALLIVAGAGLAFESGMRKRMALHREERIRSSSAMYISASQSLGAFKEIKVLGREAHFVGGFTASSRRYAGATAAFSWAGLLPRLLVETIAVSALLGAVIFGLASDQPMRDIVPALTLFGLALFRIMPSATRVLSALNSLRFNAPSVRIVAAGLRSGATATPHPAPGAPADAQSGQIRQIDLDNVSYRYPGAEGWALRGITLSIRHGELIGLVGRSGSGKTTLTDILLGLLEPQEGAVTVDGVDSNANDACWRGFAGLVSQQFFLLDDSVRRNVAFGIGDAAIDDARVWRALRDARLEARIRALPGGLVAPVGEHGAMLSGGERQRLAIARALYDDPEILVFDEATSALDSATEAEVLETVRGLAGAKTILMISHRPASLACCDRVIVMRDGVIAATGSYAELRGKEAELDESQSGGYAVIGSA